MEKLNQSDRLFQLKVGLLEGNLISIKHEVKAKMYENSFTQLTGITKGFIVTSINKRSISDVEALSTLLSQLPKDDGVLVEGVYPNGVKAYYGIGW